MAYTFLSLWIIPLGILLLVRVIPLQLRGLLRATSRCEKAYWELNAVGYLLAAYGSLTTGAQMIDRFFGSHWQLCARWPSISRCWGMSTDPVVLVLLDLLTAFAAGLAVICGARYFGYVDESDIWHRPEWMAARRLGCKPDDDVLRDDSRT